MGDVVTLAFSAIDSLMVFAVDKPNVGGVYERTHFPPFDSIDTRTWKRKKKRFDY